MISQLYAENGCAASVNNIHAYGNIMVDIKRRGFYSTLYFFKKINYSQDNL